jgi:acetylornithine deacetylase
MARVLESLEIYQHDIVGKLGEHPLCGRPTLSVGTIDGGLSVNTVPDHCTIEIDRRCLPGEDPRLAYRHAVDYLRDCLGADEFVVHDEPFSESLGLTDSSNAKLARRLQQAARDVAGRSNLVGVAYGTNAANIAAEGIPTVVFGPGSIAQAHTADEWISLEQLKFAEEIYYRFALSPHAAG